MRHLHASLLLIAFAAAFAAAPAAAAPAHWRDRADAAFAEAREGEKLVLVDLYADWCGWCKVMDKDVFSTPEFEAFAVDFVLLRVDVEDGADGTAMQRRYGAGSLPTLLLLDGKRALVGQVQGFHPTAKLLGRIRMELNKHGLAVTSYENALAGDDPLQWERRALEWHQRGDGARAAALFEKLLGRPEPDLLKAAWRRFLLADSYRIDRRFDQARRALADTLQAADSAGNAELDERVDWLGFAIARDAHDCERAEGALALLEKEHPKSTLAGEARKEWITLKSAAQCS